MKKAECKSAYEFSFDQLSIQSKNFSELVENSGIKPAEFVQEFRKWSHISKGELTTDDIDLLIEDISCDYRPKNDPTSLIFDPDSNDYREIESTHYKLISTGYIRKDLDLHSFTAKMFNTLNSSDEAIFDIYNSIEKYEKLKSVEGSDVRKILDILSKALSPNQFEIFRFDLYNENKQYRYSKAELETLTAAWENIAGRYYDFTTHSEFMLSNSIAVKIIEIVGRDYLLP